MPDTPIYMRHWIYNMELELPPFLFPPSLPSFLLSEMVGTKSKHSEYQRENKEREIKDSLYEKLFGKFSYKNE